MKSPTLYTELDLETYKCILIKTSAHLTVDGSKVRTQNSNKYTGIILKLFPTGSGLQVKLHKRNLPYCNDPNELVDRLRSLLAIKAAGNTGVSNEII